MKNKELFDRTIGILVKAYFENTLEHGSCMACAVGNLIAANCGLKVNLKRPTKKWNNDIAEWYNISIGADKRNYNYKLAKEQILSTGYSIDEVNWIEQAFERVRLFKDKNDRAFKGLMNVVDTLMQIHEANETEIAEAKQLFVLN